MAKGGSKFLRTEWVRLMTDSLARLHPDMDRGRIEDFVIAKYAKSFDDHECIIFNSYENNVSSMTLGSLLDWAESYRPLMAESGVFFYPKDQKRNVNIEIIKEGMLDARTIHKKEKFDAMQRGDVFTAAVKDIQQANDKKAANSGYGAEGQSSSFLYNINSAMSVTASGRGQLATMLLCFENLFADNVKFWNMDEFYVYMDHIVSERKNWKYDTFDNLDRIPGRSEWVKRYMGKFLHRTLGNEEALKAYYDSLDDELRARTFYKCNLRAYLRDNRVPTELFTEIAMEDDLKDADGKSMDFVDPNKIPVTIQESLEELCDLVREFVGYKYSHVRYQDKARYMKRSVIIVNDTDS